MGVFELAETGLDVALGEVGGGGDVGTGQSSRSVTRIRLPKISVSRACWAAGSTLKLSDQHRYWEVSAAPTEQEPRSAIMVSPGLAFLQMAGITPSLESRKAAQNAREELQD